LRTCSVGRSWKSWTNPRSAPPGRRAPAALASEHRHGASQGRQPAPLPSAPAVRDARGWPYLDITAALACPYLIAGYTPRGTPPLGADSLSPILTDTLSSKSSVRRRRCQERRPSKVGQASAGYPPSPPPAPAFLSPPKKGTFFARYSLKKATASVGVIGSSSYFSEKSATAPATLV
jgi:hypothetical protein